MTNTSQRWSSGTSGIVFFLSFINNTKGTSVTNPPNNTPSNFNDCQRGHVQNVHPGRARPPRASDPRRALLDEEIEYDVWLEESWAFAESQEEDFCGEA
jgi:hypothetical protein